MACFFLFAMIMWSEATRQNLCFPSILSLFFFFLFKFELHPMWVASECQKLID
jgi:hypothetical protein